MATKPKAEKKPPKIARPTVPRAIGADGRPLATEKEIAEGAAFRLMKNAMSPKSFEAACAEWFPMWEALYAECPPATGRCPRCGTRLFGRTRRDGCGNPNCGKEAEG